MPSGAVQVLEAKLEGALTAARLHAQRRREEAERHQATLDREREERSRREAQMGEEVMFLKDRLLQAEQSERELRVLIAQSVQAQQSTARELEALREERAALMAPKRVRWWQKVWGTR